MNKASQKKFDQLGMPIGTASNRLKKAIVFKLLKESSQNFCFQCGAEIESEKELSIEHKIPYLDSEDPRKLFFDLDNVAFSHHSCNIKAGRQPGKLEGINDLRATHGNAGYRRRGCRCIICKEWKSIENKKRYKAVL